MKLLSLLSFAALAAALPKASTASSSSISGSTSSVPAPSPSGSASASFVSTSGTQFTIDNKKGYYAGSNSYWIGFLTNNDDVDLVFQRMSESGLKILRVWGFNDVNSIPGDDTVWFQYHANGASQINTGANGLQRLDYVVSSAEKHGIKLIINFVNNWSDYGGMEAYTSAYGGDQKGWYTNTEIQAAYQKYIKAVVSRYTKSTAVFAWELANEPRCNGCDTDVLYNWIAKTSKYIKSLDANHLVAIGDEGFGLDIQSDGSYPYTYSEGLNFTKNLGIKDIDFGTFHLYPSSWGVPNSFGNGWVTSHGAACAAAGKPCLFEEYGVTSDHCNLESPWQKTALNATGVSADLYWQYGDTLSTGKSPDDGNTIYYGTSDFECLVTEHVKSI